MVIDWSDQKLIRIEGKLFESIKVEYVAMIHEMPIKSWSLRGRND